MKQIRRIFQTVKALRLYAICQIETMRLTPIRQALNRLMQAVFSFVYFRKGFAQIKYMCIFIRASHMHYGSSGSSSACFLGTTKKEEGILHEKTV